MWQDVIYIYYVSACNVENDRSDGGQQLYYYPQEEVPIGENRDNKNSVGDRGWVNGKD